MSIAIPLCTAVTRPEKVHKMTVTFDPSMRIGGVYEVEGEPFVVIKIHHRVGGWTATSDVDVVEPNWVWKLKYKTKRFCRHIWWRATAPVRWIRGFFWRRR